MASKQEQKIAKQRVEHLLAEAAKVFAKKKELANLYVKKARKMAMKYNVRLPSELKKKFCKNCGSFLVPGENLRVRLYKQKVIYCCLECKHHMRFPYIKEKKKKN